MTNRRAGAIVAPALWAVQYGLCLPAYACWRLFARSAWLLLAVCTFGLSALIRHFLKKHDREHQELIGRTPTTYQWRAITRPW